MVYWKNAVFSGREGALQRFGTYLTSHCHFMPSSCGVSYAGGKMNLQMHGKEFFQTSVSTFF